LTLDSEP